MKSCKKNVKGDLMRKFWLKARLRFECCYSQDMLQTGCQANTLDIVNSLLNTVRSGSISSVLKLLIIQSKEEYSLDTTCPYKFLQL